MSPTQRAAVASEAMRHANGTRLDLKSFDFETAANAIAVTPNRKGSPTCK